MRRSWVGGAVVLVGVLLTVLSCSAAQTSSSNVDRAGPSGASADEIPGDEGVIIDGLPAGAGVYLIRPARGYASDDSYLVQVNLVGWSVFISYVPFGSHDYDHDGVARSTVDIQGTTFTELVRSTTCSGSGARQVCDNDLSDVYIRGDAGYLLFKRVGGSEADFRSLLGRCRVVSGSDWREYARSLRVLHEK